MASQIQSSSRQAPKWAQKLPGIMEAAHMVGSAIMVALQTAIAGVGVLLILAGVLVVEVDRVAWGVMVIKDNWPAAMLGATVLVLLLLTLEFVIHYTEARANWYEAQQQFSVRLWLQGVGYRLGISSNWQPRAKSPAHAIRSYARLLTMSILALALLGSMRTSIEAAQGAWHVAIVSILTTATLAEFTTWAGGLLYAYALVFGAQRITSYVAVRASEMIATLEAQQAEVTPEVTSQNVDSLPTVAIVDIFDTQPLPHDVEEDTQPVTPIRNSQLDGATVTATVAGDTGEYDTSSYTGIGRTMDATVTAGVAAQHTERHCLTCNKTLRNMSPKARYCSATCRAEAARKRNKASVN